MALVAATAAGCDPYGAAAIVVPGAPEWRDCGTPLVAGADGEWDALLYSGFAAAVVERRGDYFLYYQGARGYRASDGSAVGRAIGVATSPDGLAFEKFPENPVLTWSPTGDGEEGAVSSAPVAASGDRLVMYYGANTAIGGDEVRADARLAVSRDGFRFQDVGVALSGADPAVWGSGDELFPVAAIRDEERWVLYYVPNGVPETGKLGVAWGEAPDRLTTTRGVRSGFRSVAAWGAAAAIPLGPRVYALFLSQRRGVAIDVRIVHLDRPHRLSRPVATYRFPDMGHATAHLDRARGIWILYHRDSEGLRYRLKVAPARRVDGSPVAPWTGCPGAGRS